MRLKWLKVSNRVRNWNKVKKFIFVESKLELCQLEMPTFIYKLMCQSSLIKLFINVLWIYSCNDLKWRQKYYFITFIISSSKIEMLVSFSRSTNVNVNMSFPNSNFEGNFSTYRDLKSECCKSRHILCKKILNFFKCVEVIILCKKVNYVWSSHFPDAITTNMQIGYDSFVFKYPVTCKKKFQNSH